jgi:hypothetical protein
MHWKSRLERISYNKYEHYYDYDDYNMRIIIMTIKIGTTDNNIIQTLDCFYFLHI